MEVNAFTAAEIMCRKILMHVAVDKGANEGETFAKYIDYLEQSNYFTPDMADWVDQIRQNGNEFAHELPALSEKRAKSTVTFTAHLLKLIYEMEHLANEFTAPPSGSS